MLGGARQLLHRLGGWVAGRLGGWLLRNSRHFYWRSKETNMEQGKGLAGLFLVISLLQGTVAQQKQEKHLVKVDDSQGDGFVLLTCDLNEKTITWLKDGQRISPPNATKSTWNLGNGAKDPRGMYQCQGAKKKSQLLQVYYRLCENCIELNMGTVSGFIFAEIISIFFLAVGVYFIAGQDGVRQSRASDKQTLLQNEQVYQPLKDREYEQYSRLQGNQVRKK